MATIFSEDFNRADSNTVGNGWGEEEVAAGDAKIVSNKLALLTADAAVIHRSPPAGQYKSIIIRFIVEFDTASGTGGVAVRYSTGGRNVHSGSLVIDISTNGTTGTLNVLDDGVSKGSFTKALATATQYNVRWDIHPDHSMDVRLWQVGSGEPASPDLTIAAFTPANTDTLWAIGNRNGIRFDSFTVDELFEIFDPQVVTVTDVPNVALVLQISVNETIAAADVPSLAIVTSITISTSDSITVSEAVTILQQNLFVSVFDSVAIAESTSLNVPGYSYAVSVNDAIAVAESMTVRSDLNPNRNDTVSVVDSPIVSVVHQISLSDSIAVTEFIDIDRGDVLRVSVNDSIVVTLAGAMIASPPYQKQSKNTTIWSSGAKQTSSWSFMPSSDE